MAIEIGQKVRVRGIQERIPNEIVKQLQQNPYGIVKDYKMTDGSQVGFVVEFENNLSTWFFDKELEVAE